MLYPKTILLLVCFFVCILPTWGQSISRRNAIVDVVEKTGESIVNISTEQLIRNAQQPLQNDEFFDEFFGLFQPRVYKTQSLGSGVLIDPEGFIITNEHVVKRARKITVVLQDKTRYSAEILAIDKKNDLALLKINSSNLFPYVKWGISSDIMIGENSIALGNPFGLQNTVTTGVISGTNRSLAVGGKVYFRDFIQTDAAINPGNSGGALLNIHGQLIGINTAIYSKGQGLGFAIPVDRVRTIIGRLLNYRKIKKYWLGLELQEIVKKNVSWQVRIQSVAPNSSASEQNLKRGDYIIGINGIPVNCLFDFRKTVFLKDFGNSISLKVLSGENVRSVTLTVNSLPLSEMEKKIWQRLGVLIEGTRRGMKIIAVRKDSPAARIHVKEGDIILSVGRYAVKQAIELNKVLRFYPNKEIIPVVIVRNGTHLEGKLILE